MVSFVCQTSIATAILFALLLLLDMGSVMLRAALVVAHPSSTDGNYLKHFVLNVPAKEFIAYAVQSSIQHAAYYAVVSGILSAAAEIYWTMRRARNMMPPPSAMAHR